MRAKLRNKKNCECNFDSCRTLSPAAVQLRKLVVRSTKSPPAAVPPAKGREAKLREPPVQRVTSEKMPGALVIEALVINEY